MLVVVFLYFVSSLLSRQRKKKPVPNQLGIGIYSSKGGPYTNIMCTFGEYLCCIGVCIKNNVLAPTLWDLSATYLHGRLDKKGYL